MLFNSFGYLPFFALVFVLYWLVLSHQKDRNLLLLIASYCFYSFWDWRFSFLLLFSTCLDFAAGLLIVKYSAARTRKTFLVVSIGINLSLLIFFKYINFLLANIHSLFSSEPPPAFLNIILPVGISFYTFHGISYLVDVYRKRIGVEKNFVVYALFVSFFPLLVAGPIERANHLLPQLHRERKFSRPMAVDGLRQVLWGLFKKIVIADGCSGYVNEIFNHHHEYGGSTLLLGSVLFAFQIYGDFSGYSDIALGSAKLLSINLIQNFKFPYFSRDVAEFWRRWHISLSTWFRDYVYIPLGGSSGGTTTVIRNTFIIFLISGIWHGANWTFIFWGALNALLFVPLMILGRNRNNLEIVATDRALPSVKELAQIGITFLLITITWIFFRAPSIGTAFEILSKICSSSLFHFPGIIQHVTNSIIFPKTILLLIVILFVMEWLSRRGEHGLSVISSVAHPGLRMTAYLILVFMLFWFGQPSRQFIYFQF